MSQLKTDALKKEARKQQAMRRTGPKVKPVVVKHVLNNQVMSIYDIKVIITQSEAFQITIVLCVDPYGEGLCRGSGTGSKYNPIQASPASFARKRSNEWIHSLRTAKWLHLEQFPVE